MRINRYRQKKKQLNGSRIGRLIGFGATALVIALGTNIRQAFKLTDQFPLIMINDAPPLPPPTIPKKRQLLVSPTDSIFARNDFTSSEFAPIVNEEYRLVFFPTPPSTLFKKLLRRIQGFEDWNDRSPHHVKDNGLKYLWDFDREKASAIMTSKKYKRVIFTRDPKERFYSLYHDVVLRTNGNYVLNKCCPSTRDCLNPVREDTFLKLIQTCRDPQWTPQVDRMEEKYWEYINFVGNWDTIEQDTQTLLQDLGIWNSFGENGWGPWRNQSLAERLAINYQNQQRHALMDEFYNEQLERRVEDAYKRDYDNPKMRFQRSPIVSLNDYIYKKDLDVWDGAPVVVEEYKLLFFTVPKVACTTWKQVSFFAADFCYVCFVLVRLSH